MNKPLSSPLVACLSLCLISSLGCQSTGAAWPGMGWLSWNRTTETNSNAPKPPSQHFAQGRGFSPNGGTRDSGTRVADNTGRNAGTGRNSGGFNNTSDSFRNSGVGARNASFSNVRSGSGDQFSQSGPYNDGNFNRPGGVAAPQENSYIRGGQGTQQKWSQNNARWDNNNNAGGGSRWDTSGISSRPSGTPHQTRWNQNGTRPSNNQSDVRPAGFGTPSHFGRDNSPSGTSTQSGTSNWNGSGSRIGSGSGGLKGAGGGTSNSGIGAGRSGRDFGGSGQIGNGNRFDSSSHSTRGGFRSSLPKSDFGGTPSASKSSPWVRNSGGGGAPSGNGSGSAGNTPGSYYPKGNGGSGLGTPQGSSSPTGTPRPYLPGSARPWDDTGSSNKGSRTSTPVGNSGVGDSGFSGGTRSFSPLNGDTTSPAQIPQADRGSAFQIPTDDNR